MPFHVGYFGFQAPEIDPSKRTANEIFFTAQDWRNKNFLRIIRTGIPGANEVGPHNLPVGGYIINIYQNNGNIDLKHVLTDILIDRTTGTITLWKSGQVIPFSGRAELVYAAS